MTDVPGYDEFLKCERPDCMHEEAEPIIGLYGMLGGGMGPYTVCSKCGDLLSKSQDNEIMCDSHATEIKDAPESNQAEPTTEHDK